MRFLNRARGFARSLVVYYGQVWRNEGRRRFYAQFIHPGALCIDVGAHVGDRVRTWRQLGARVIAVEPQPDFVRWLEWLFANDSQVEVLAQGLGAKEGTLELHVSEAHPTLATFSSQWISDVQADPRFHVVSWDRKTTVAVSTLDALIGRFGVPAFVKIDVEGFELEVLAGLSQPVPVVSFEFIPVAKEAACACVDRLAALGRYEFRHSMVETMRWASDRWMAAEEMKTVLRAQPLQGRSGDVYARLTPTV